MFMGNMAVVLWALFIGGFAIIALELFYKKRGQRNAADLSAISYKQAFFIGIFQSLAFIPGVSRSAATIFGGLFMGLKREAIVEFSFLLAIPTMLAAAGLDILKTRAVLSQGDIGSIMIGFITAFVIALASIKWFVGFIKKNDFIPFGIYRIALVALFWLFVK
jgi:undecaprenyl-diphosphatase